MVGFRNKGFKLLPLLLAGCILMTSQGVMAARTAAMGSKPVITIALVDTFSPDFYLHTYVPTVDYLRTHLPQYEFRIKEIDYRDIICQNNFRHSFSLTWSGKTCDIRRSL